MAAAPPGQTPADQRPNDPGIGFSLRVESDGEVAERGPATLYPCSGRVEATFFAGTATNNTLRFFPAGEYSGVLTGAIEYWFNPSDRSAGVVRVEIDVRFGGDAQADGTYEATGTWRQVGFGSWEPNTRPPSRITAIALGGPVACPGRPPSAVVTAPPAPEAGSTPTLQVRQLPDGTYVTEWQAGSAGRVPVARITPGSPSVKIERRGESIWLNVPETVRHEPGSITLVENPEMRVSVRYGAMWFTPTLEPEQFFDVPKWAAEAPDNKKKLKVEIDFVAKVAASVISKAVPQLAWVGYAADLAEIGGTVAGTYYDAVHDLVSSDTGPTVRIQIDRTPNLRPGDRTGDLVPTISVHSDVRFRSTDDGTAFVYVFEGQADVSGGPGTPTVSVPAGSYSLCSQGGAPADPMPFDVEAWTPEDPSVIDRSAASEAWARDWTVLATAMDFGDGAAAGFYEQPVSAGQAHPNQGRTGILYLHPVSEPEPARLVRRVTIAPGASTLSVGVSGNRDTDGDWQLVVKADGQDVGAQTIAGTDGWQDLSFDLSRFAGQTVDLEIDARANDWRWEFAFFDYIELGSVAPLPRRP